MNIEQKDIFFHQIDVGDMLGLTIILDIDGTLVCSSQTEVSQEVKDKIHELQVNNVVYIFSNNYDGVRSREIAKSLNLPYIESPHKKPSVKVLNYIDETCPVIAIGDKYLTDGLFAQFIGAKHIRVKRYSCKEDSALDKIACFFDDVMYAIAKLIRLVD